MPQQTSSSLSKTSVQTASGALTFSRKKKLWKETNKRKKSGYIYWVKTAQIAIQFHLLFTANLQAHFHPTKEKQKHCHHRALLWKKVCRELLVWQQISPGILFWYLLCTKWQMWQLILKKFPHDNAERKKKITVCHRFLFWGVFICCFGLVCGFFLLTIRSYLTKQVTSHKAHAFNSKKHSQYCKALNSSLGSHSEDATTSYVWQWHLTLDSHSIPDFQIPVTGFS